jgi:hypothetical protein
VRQIKTTELGGLNLELEGDSHLRQFINLIDEEGEESFIPMEQIIVMKVANEVIFPDLEETEKIIRHLINARKQIAL